MWGIMETADDVVVSGNTADLGFRVGDHHFLTAILASNLTKLTNRLPGLTMESPQSSPMGCHRIHTVDGRL